MYSTSDICLDRRAKHLSHTTSLINLCMCFTASAFLLFLCISQSLLSPSLSVWSCLRFFPRGLKVSVPPELPSQAQKQKPSRETLFGPPRTEISETSTTAFHLTHARRKKHNPRHIQKSVRPSKNNTDCKVCACDGL